MHLYHSYNQIRQYTLFLTQTLSAEDQMIQSMLDASPSKWHLAHSSWFFETFILQAHSARYKLFDASYSYLFNSYYNALGAQYPRADRSMMSRPSLHAVMAYRAHVDQAMQNFLQQEALDEALRALIILGLHHEQQHQELLLTDIKHAFWHNPTFPVMRDLPDLPEASVVQKDVLTVASGVYHIGCSPTKKEHFNDFCFDNESPVHRVYLEAYGVENLPVTNGEFLAFMDAGGYQNPLLWLADGWHWVQKKAIQSPLYWRYDKGEWQHFTLHGMQPLWLDAPVSHVSYYEACAYAQFKGCRLPTESQWEVAVREHGISPSPVNSYPLWQPHAAQPSWFHSVWQWTESAYNAYPGFKAFVGTAGEYNGKFMSQQIILRGGSCMSSPGHTRSSYRNFFYPSARWQATGIRLRTTIKAGNRYVGRVFGRSEVGVATAAKNPAV